MTDPEFRLKLTADGDIAKQVAQDVAAMNKLDAAAKSNVSTITNWNRQRASLARQRRAEMFEELSTTEKLTRLRERQIQVERRLLAAQSDPRRTAALQLRRSQLADQLRGMSGSGLPPVLPGQPAVPGGKMSGALARVAGRMLPGGGLGGAMSAGLGGGLAATAGVGAVFAGVYGLKALVAEAKLLDTTADATSRRIAEQYKMSNSAIDSLSAFGTIFETIWAFVKKMAAEGVAVMLQNAATALGAFISSLGWLASFVPGKTAGKVSESLSQTGDQMIAMGTGADLGYQAAGAAEQRLQEALAGREETRGKAAQRKRDKARRMAGAVETPTFSGGGGFTMPVDDLARMGLYRGASSGGAALAVQRDQLQELRTLTSVLRTTPVRIAEEL